MGIMKPSDFIFREALQKLEQTNFRISPAVRTAFLKRNS